MTQQIQPHILLRYQVVQKLGKGAYGLVWKAVDRKKKIVVALKKVFDAFHNATDAQRTYRQVNILQQLGNHQNIVKIQGVIRSDNNKDLYIVFDYMETDVFLATRANLLQPIHQSFIIFQLIKALKYMQSAQVIHRDLKPSNLLIDSHCRLKVADFGLARSLAPDLHHEMVLTQYVATRWYRAPEILLGSTRYTMAADMWSVGCILGELITKKAIFMGSSTLNQIQIILDLLGKPTEEDIQELNSPLASSVLFNVQSHKPKKANFNQYFPSASKLALDFLKKVLVVSPVKRLTAAQALQHPYLAQFRTQQLIQRKILNKQGIYVEQLRAPISMGVGGLE